MGILQERRIMVSAWYRSQWFNYITCLAATLFMTMGEGSYLFQIVPYLEMRNVGAFDIGVTNGVLSAVEAVACLLIGYLYKNRQTRRYMVCGILLLQSSAVIMMFQPSGFMVKLASGLNGFGIGILLVLVHSTLLANRPTKISLGLTVGIYTSGIAAGNAIGAAVSGFIVDTFGFVYGFSYCLISFTGFLAAVFMIQMNRSRHHAEVVADKISRRVKHGHHEFFSQPWMWKTSLIAGFSMACIIIVSEVIFPIYALRSGLSVSFLGSLHGIKMMLAAIIRPFSGFILVYINSALLTILSLVILAAAVICLPFVGLSYGLVLLSGVIGLTFGTCRVTSATLSVENVKTNAENSRRIALYSFALSFGQIITPFIGGWSADAISLPATIVGLPIIFLGIFFIGLIFTWRSNTAAVR